MSPVPEAQRYWIRQARVPICFLPGGPKTAVDRDGATLIDLFVDNERIAAIEPAGAAASADLPAIDLESHIVLTYRIRPDRPIEGALSVGGLAVAGE
jgi:hypothetical protein